MKPDITIITPVYKAQEYLPRCVESLLAQTFTNFELILIDDGSPDSSGALCDEYALKDSRVKVIHKENGGVSSARQCGIEHASGLYTIHADPDDWANPTMLQTLYDTANATNADIVICDYFTHKRGKTRYISQKPKDLAPEALLRQLLKQELHGALWNKLIRTSLYTRHSITFPQHITRWEDLFVVCSILLATTPVIAHLPKAFYHYDLSTNANSIVRKKSYSGLQSQMLFVKHFQQALPSEKFNDELYAIKAATKELAYNSGTMPAKELIELYSEINARYIATANPDNPRQLCLARFLSGEYSYRKSKTARRILNIRHCIRRIFRQRKAT